MKLLNMKFLKKYLLVATFAGCLLTSGTAFGAETKYYKRAFDATNEVTDSKNTTFETRLASDGKGHVLSQSKSAFGDNSTIMDYTTKTMCSVMETPKLIIKDVLRDVTQKDVDPAAKKDVKSLGEKTINGHPCKGESYTVGKSKVEVWTGTDIDYAVKTVVDVNDTKITTELKSFSTKQPPEKLFEVPKEGYKLLDRVATKPADGTIPSNLAPPKHPAK